MARVRWRAYCPECNNSVNDLVSKGEAEHLARIHNDGCPAQAGAVERVEQEQSRDQEANRDLR